MPNIGEMYSAYNFQHLSTYFILQHGIAIFRILNHNVYVHGSFLFVYIHTQFDYDFL